MDKGSNQRESSKSPQIQQQKALISIESYLSNPNQQITLSSPRSLKAMRQLGYTQEDFYYMTFKEYISTHHDIRQLSPQIQNHRYAIQDEIRIAKIKQVAELRETIDINQANSSTKEKTIQVDNELFSQSDVKSTAVAEEIKAYERIKRKNEADLINMVEYELKKQIMLKEAEQRMRKQQFKVTQFQRQVQLTREQEALMQKNREEQKQFKQLENEEKQRQLNAIRYSEEQKRLQKQMEEEENRHQLNKLKHEEDERKRIAFERKVDQMLEAKLARANELREQIDQKEEERRIALENRRHHQMCESKEKEQQKQELIQRNLVNLNDHLESVRQKYLMKQKENELKKERLDIERDNELKQRQEEARLRAEKTKNVLDRDRDIQKKKLDDYNTKQQLIAMEKQIIEKEKIKQQQEHRRAIEEKELQRLNTIAKNEEILNQRKMNIMAKMSNKEEMTKKCQEKSEQEKMEKAETDYQRRLLSANNIRRVEIMRENKREDTLNWIMNKSNRIQFHKDQKEMLSEKKRDLKDSISRKKEEYEAKFQAIFHKKDMNEKTIETIHQMFPGNERINVLLLKLDELEKDNANQSQVEREYEEMLHKTLTEFKKSISHSSNSNTIRQTKQEKKWISKRSKDESSEGFKHINKGKEKEKEVKEQVTEGDLFKSKPMHKANRDKSKPKALRAKSKTIDRDQIDTKTTSTVRTNNTVASTKAHKNSGAMYQSNNSPEFTFKQNGDSKNQYTSSNTMSNNDKYNQSDKTMQSSSQLRGNYPNDEREIEKKVNKYKLNLSNELLALIAKEKMMEQKRVEQYSQAQGMQKEEMRKKMGEERALSSLRIIEKNDEIEEKLKEYQDKLRQKVTRSGYN